MVSLRRFIDQPGASAGILAQFSKANPASETSYATDGAANVFRPSKNSLRPVAFRFHCFDFILQGAGQDYDLAVGRNLLTLQARLEGRSDETEFHDLLERLKVDVETVER